MLLSLMINVIKKNNRQIFDVKLVIINLLSIELNFMNLSNFIEMINQIFEIIIEIFEILIELSFVNNNI